MFRGPDWVRFQLSLYPVHADLKLIDTIIAMVGEQVVRVQCNTCGGTHNYHAPKAEKPAGEVKSRGEYFVSEATDLAEVLPTLLNIHILKVETEATAAVFVNLVDLQNRTETGKFRLRMVNGQWRIMSCDF